MELNEEEKKMLDHLKINLEDLTFCSGGCSKVAIDQQNKIVYKWNNSKAPKSIIKRELINLIKLNKKAQMIFDNYETTLISEQFEGEKNLIESFQGVDNYNNIFKNVYDNNINFLKLFDIYNQMKKEIEKVHKKQIVHCDIKLNNFVWDGENVESIKLIDFGLSHNKNEKTKLCFGNRYKQYHFNDCPEYSDDWNNLFETFKDIFTNSKYETHFHIDQDEMRKIRNLKKPSEMYKYLLKKAIS